MIKNLTIPILLMSMGVMAELKGYVCEYEYDNKTFTFSYWYSRDHANTRVSFGQEIGLEYVIFGSEGEPMAIKGNPMFESITDPDWSEFGKHLYEYTGTAFYADWQDAGPAFYTDWQLGVNAGTSECIVNPDLYFKKYTD